MRVMGWVLAAVLAARVCLCVEMAVRRQWTLLTWKHAIHDAALYAAMIVWLVWAMT